MRKERTEITYCFKFQCILEVSELRFDSRLLYIREVMPFNVDSNCPDSVSISTYSSLQT